MLWEKVSKFGVKTVIADTGVAFQREGDRFIMQEFLRGVTLGMSSPG
jgi:hypothetical protein